MGRDSLNCLRPSLGRSHVGASLRTQVATGQDPGILERQECERRLQAGDVRGRSGVAQRGNSIIQSIIIIPVLVESPFPLKTSLKVHNKTVDLLSSSGAAEAAAAAEKQRVKITRVTKRCHQVHPRLSKGWHCLISCVCFKAARRHCLLCLPDTSDVNVATRLSRETPAKKKRKVLKTKKVLFFLCYS